MGYVIATAIKYLQYKIFIKVLHTTWHKVNKMCVACGGDITLEHNALRIRRSTVIPQSRRSL